MSDAEGPRRSEAGSAEGSRLKISCTSPWLKIWQAVMAVPQGKVPSWVEWWEGGVRKLVMGSLCHFGTA